ncbi:DUF5672 family protein [Mucilaginibacter sp.]|uniref:DUF5672 family protein n=1 Tax=Mucilaginibacter sp. TaxID=1882438 RepID=UPI0035BBAEF1
MNADPNMCVIIPVHQPLPSAAEMISLKAARRHLSGYDCYLVHPIDMDIAAYLAIYPGLKLKAVNPQWLASVEQYNKMKLDLRFYQLFAQYQYMLTYELDAYIFNANFSGTNVFQFDFIGAPFFEGYWAATFGAPFIKGCNSGFSIRNIPACINVLSSMGRFKTGWLLYRVFLSWSSNLRRLINNATGGRYEIYINGKFGFPFAGFHLNEDHVWSEVVPQLFPWFKIADPVSALTFSFEYNLTESLKLNGGKLPLGCHAWYKHLDFWKEYIDTGGLQ